MQNLKAEHAMCEKKLCMFNGLSALILECPVFVTNLAS